MALIEFYCEKCQKSFEKFVDFSEDREKIVCPDCGEKAKQSFSGKCYGRVGKGGGCSGDCKNCKGCH